MVILDHGDAAIIFDASLWIEKPHMTGQVLFDVAPGDVRVIYEKVRNRAEVLWGPEVYDYGRREFSCRDPNGYALVFSEPASNPLTCPSGD